MIRGAERWEYRLGEGKEGEGEVGGGCVLITMQIDLSGFNVDERVRCWDCVSRGC